MAAFSKAKYSEFENFDIINDDFETAVLENNYYDFIYSAGAFQWIQQDIGYRKIHSLLKSGGVMALFWHRMIPAEEYAHVQAAIHKVYDKYHNIQEIDIDVYSWNNHGIAFWTSLGFEKRYYNMRYGK